MKSRIYAWASICTSVAGLAQAQPLLDEEHAPSGSFGSLAVANDRTQIQTFQVDFTGLLTQVQVKVERQPQTVEDLVLSVWSTDADQLPDRELVTTSVPASAVPVTSTRVFVSFDLTAADIFVTAGSRLAIALDSAAENTAPFLERWAWEIGGFYAKGRTYTLVSGTVVAGHAEDLHFRAYVEPAQVVNTDIRPRNDRNQLNLRSRGLLPLAVLTEPGFDATALDTASIRFGEDANEAVPVSSNAVDVDSDGDTDLLLRFKVQDTGIQCGQTLASLSGRTLRGELIFDLEPILTVGCQ